MKKRLLFAECSRIGTTAAGLLIIVCALATMACVSRAGATESGLNNKNEQNNNVAPERKEIEILNVSYDPTRELYRAYNEKFAAWYKEKTGRLVTVKQSHGGSGGQSKKIVKGEAGSEADVVTLALASDIDAIVNARQIIAPDWIKRFHYNSAPYNSTIVFLVRSGNPKKIKDWDDLVKPGIAVITPDPKSSGGARWNYLAAWSYARHKYGSEEAAERFVQKLLANVTRFDASARKATNTFVKDGIGDVLLAWENEAFLTIDEHGADKFAIVTPSLSILAEPSVTYIDANVKAHGTKDVAVAYLEYLYSKDGQRIAGQNYYRPSDPNIAQEFYRRFKTLDLVMIDREFGGWPAAQKTHFADGGTYDRIMEANKKR